MNNIEQFKKVLSSLNIVKSITGLDYKIRRVTFNKIYFSRGIKSEEENINISELYNLSLQGSTINTSIAKKYISGKVQSPAVAIINHIRKNTLVSTSSVSKIERPNMKELLYLQSKPIIYKPKDQKDETRFFYAFLQLAGDKIRSKSLGNPIGKGAIWLDKDFRQYKFQDEVLACFNHILDELKSNLDLGSGSLIQYIDGAIEFSEGHFRIVEFDEEQHFTPARFITIEAIKKITEAPYLIIYENICKNATYYEREVCAKNRIRKNKKLTQDYEEFLRLLVAENSSGYIEAKNGFNYIGGRIAQRAYYDTLRDTAHLSPLNPNLGSPIRLAKKAFEDIAKKPFGKISDEELIGLLTILLQDLYGTVL